MQKQEFEPDPGVAVHRVQEGAALTLSSRQLFRHGNTVRIEHGTCTYQLRLTRENKLILTK